MIQEISAGTVLFRREKSKIFFLLLHYPSGHWDFVKGKKEFGETHHRTALREAREETGITDIEFVNNFEEWIEYNFQYEGELVQKKVVFFLAETKTKEIVISFEHQDFVWLEFDDAIKKITFENAKKILKKANSVLNDSF